MIQRVGAAVVVIAMVGLYPASSSQPVTQAPLRPPLESSGCREPGGGRGVGGVNLDGHCMYFGEGFFFKYESSVFGMEIEGFLFLLTA